MSRGLSHWLIAPAVVLLAAAVALGAAGVAVASPTPSCSWTSTAYLQHQFGFRLNRGKASQVTGNELDCAWSERHPRFTARGEPAVLIQYFTFGSFTIAPSSKPVRGMGSCHGQCQSMGGQTAPSWLTVYQGTGPNLRHRPYQTMVELDVQDGSNFFSVIVRDDVRPLPAAKHLVARVEQVARTLVKRFYANA